MTRLGRLRDCFEGDVEPDSVLFCTYGFEPRFFEAEILPALFPRSLSSDRKAGSMASYFYAADQLAQRHDIVVLFDHTDAGHELGYASIKVSTGGRAFHPKLVLLDYGSFLRVVVSSANLTRPGWVHQFETFIFDDLTIDGAHAWSAPLRNFLQQVQPLMPTTRSRARITPFLDRLARVGDAPPSDLTLVSTFDGPLLDALIAAMPDATRVDVVSPFFESEAGRGVFDLLRERLPNATGRLFLRAQTADDNMLEVVGPGSKIMAAVATGRWTLHQVLNTWPGDEDDAPTRQLHGKIIALRRGSRAITMIGSPNLTRAALLHSAPAGNVEVAVVATMRPQGLAAIIPDHCDLDPRDVRWTKRENQDSPSEGPGRWIQEAVYWATDSRLEVWLADDAPPLTLSYEQIELAQNVLPPIWNHHPFELKKSTEIEVSDGATTGVVPLLIEEFAAMTPRGTPRNMTFEEFLEVLAGNADPISDTFEGAPPPPPQPTPPVHVTGGSTLAWRKLMRALDRLEREFEAEACFPRGVEFLIKNPSRLGGLQARLDDRAAHSLILPADHAFAVHLMRRSLTAARGRMGVNTESIALVDDAILKLKRTFEQHRKNAQGALRIQLTMLAKEI